MWSAYSLEHLGELAVHLLRARVRVRLLDRDDPPVTDDGAGRVERGGDLGGVVGVIVEDAHAALDTVQLEAAHRALEAFDRTHGGLERVAERQQHGDGSGRVDRVVRARNREPRVDGRRRRD